ncbi:MAG: alpha/beta hydrolase [Acidobacteria bacterium]|nr:alpha/beta hydrolase [Acidobacteriota bacterium]
MTSARRVGGAVLGRLLAAAVMVILPALPAPGQEAAVPRPSAPPVELPGTERLSLRSRVTGQEYALHVSLPRGYDKTGERFPVIYAVDGQWDFTLVHAIYGQQYYDGFLPGAIIVGITWGGETPDYDRRRAFDLTPTPGGQPDRYGNAARFLEFIEKEAIPFVEARYRAARDGRTLTGSSFGGLFTLYALFTRPALFDRYVLTSPAWSWDNQVLLRHGEQFARSPLPKPVKVFMGVGEYEDVAGFEKLAATIRGYGLAGLDLETRVIAGAGHSGAKTEGFTRGLQFVFARPCARVPPEALSRLAGEYELGPAPAAVVRIAVEDGGLVAYPPSGPKVRLCADSDLDFRLVGQYLKVHFIQAADKTVGSFRLEQYDGEAVAKRRK